MRARRLLGTLGGTLMARGLKELAVYGLTTYVTLLFGAAIAIWMFDFYEPKIGGRLGNLVLYTAISAPVTLVAALGYAVAAYLRDLRRVVIGSSYRCAFEAGFVSALASPFVLMSGAGFTDDAHTNLALTVAYTVCVGALSGWLCALFHRVSPRAA
jgi:hypothetical protein